MLKGVLAFRGIGRGWVGGAGVLNGKPCLPLPSERALGKGYHRAVTGSEVV